MAEVLFRVGEVGKARSWSKGLHLPDAMGRLDARVGSLTAGDKGRGYQLNWENSRWPAEGQWYTDANDALLRVKDRLSGVDRAGVDAFIRTRAEGRIFRIKSVEVGGDFNYSGTITPHCREFCEEYFDAFPDAENWGIYNRRPIAGTDTWSQHSWGNAVDSHFDSNQRADAAQRWVTQRKGPLNVRNSLWRVANHYDHRHDDFDPQGTGTPPR